MVTPFLRRSVKVCGDTLFINGPLQLVYICDLSAIIQKGKVDHQLSEVSTSFRMRSETHGMEIDRELRTISCFGRTDIANLEYKDYENGGLSKIRVYDLKEIAKLGSAGIKGSQYDIAAQVSMPERSISNVAFERLVNNLFAVGYFTHNNRSAEFAPSIRLMLFQYRPSSSQMFMLTDNSFQIDQQRLAQLPSYQDFVTSDQLILGTSDQIIFGTHRRRIFAIVILHDSTSVYQIYCYHRKQFQLIGGTNCKTPGLYIMDHCNTVRFYKDPVYGGLHGISCFITIDHRTGIAHSNFSQLRLCF